MTSFYVGQNFSTFSEFEQHLSCYENENFVKFSKRDSRKIETAIRTGKTKVELNPELIYYDIKYNCVRGGAFRVQGSGKRKTSSCKIDCTAHILLRAAADGKTLEVKSFNDIHNHEISKLIKGISKAKRKRRPNDAIPELQENRSQNFQEIMLNEEIVMTDSTTGIIWNSAVITENICPQPQTPKMSEAIVPSTHNSTKQGPKSSLQKRKRMYDEIEDREEKNIKKQSDIAAELKKLAHSTESLKETSNAFLQTLVNIKNNVANISQKMDLIVNLLSSSLQ